jgi:hypothetical protein
MAHMWNLGYAEKFSGIFTLNPYATFVYVLLRAVYDASAGRIGRKRSANTASARRTRTVNCGTADFVRAMPSVYHLR